MVCWQHWFQRHTCIHAWNRRIIKHYHHASYHSDSEINFLSVNWEYIHGYNTMWSLLQSCILKWFFVCKFQLWISFSWHSIWGSHTVKGNQLKKQELKKQLKGRTLLWYIQVLVSVVHKISFKNLVTINAGVTLRMKNSYLYSKF